MLGIFFTVIPKTDFCNFRVILISVFGFIIDIRYRATTHIRHFQYIHVIHHRIIFIQYQITVVLHISINADFIPIHDFKFAGQFYCITWIQTA